MYSSVPNAPLTWPVVEGPVDHVVFVIHGIGRQTENFGFFQKHLQSLSDTTHQAIKKNQPGKQTQVQYIPIEWHMHIHQETDSVMNQITPRSIPLLRLVNNDYLADAFFYLSPERGESIVRHVTHTLNTCFQSFMDSHPGFGGKIAIMAYSLGGIIAWDILSHQTHSGLSLKERHQRSKLTMTFPSLDFKPDFLFNLGSPLSAFLIVRNQDPKIYHPDPTIRFENIVHPFDPLGYRFEPLLNPEAQDIPSAQVERCADLFLEPFTQHPFWDTGRRWLHSLLKRDCPKEEIGGKRKERPFTVHEPGSKRQLAEPDLSTLTRASVHTDVRLCPSWPRIDYVLPKSDGFLGSLSYLSGLTAHFSYWTHSDLLWHVVRRLEKKE